VHLDEIHAHLLARDYAGTSLRRRGDDALEKKQAHHNGEKRVGCRRLPYVDRTEPLTPATLLRTFQVLSTVFTPDALARQLTARLSELSNAGGLLGANLGIAIDGTRIVPASAVGVFVDDETHAKFRTMPLDRFDDWIVNDVLQPGGGCLTYREIARRNAGPGLRLLLLCFKAVDHGVGDSDRMVIIHGMMTWLFPEFLGYNLKSLTGRVRHLSQVTSGIQAGCRLLRPETIPSGPTGHELLPLPALLTAERDSVELAAWVGSAFVWRKPLFGFSAPNRERSVLRSVATS
jgi:hypothetical protein